MDLSRFTPNREWDGKEKDILILAPDSAGDVFERSRHLSVLSKRGVNWIMMLRADFIPLMQQIFPDNRFIAYGNDAPEFGAWTRLMDGLEKVSSGRPEPRRLIVPQSWQRFSFSKPSIGICIRAAERLATYKSRCIAPQDAKALARALNVNWISLQYREILPEPIKNLDIKTWQDTAAIIEKLDAVVSVDTSVAHLCAWLRKPCVILHGTAHTSVVNYLRFSELYRGLPYREFFPTYGGFEGGQPSWKKFAAWAKDTPQWWLQI